MTFSESYYAVRSIEDRVSIQGCQGRLLSLGRECHRRKMSVIRTRIRFNWCQDGACGTVNPLDGEWKSLRKRLGVYRIFSQPR